MPYKNQCLSPSPPELFYCSYVSLFNDCFYLKIKLKVLFVCVEVLRPSQPNGVMSSTVSLPNHTFTGQA